MRSRANWLSLTPRIQSPKLGFLRYRLSDFLASQFEEQGKARLGIRECVDHGLVDPYSVLEEKEGEEVAHFMYTVLLMPAGPLKITGLPYYDNETIKSDKVVKDDKAKDILRQGVKKTKPKKPAA